MRSKPLTALLLVIVLIINGAVVFYLADSWLRLTLGLLLLVPIIRLAAHLGVAEMLPDLPGSKSRDRRFPALRKSVVALLDEVKRLNWLVVDLQRGFRNHETVEAEINMSEGRLGELLAKIRETAGQPVIQPGEGAGPSPEDAPAEAVSESRD